MQIIVTAKSFGDGFILSGGVFGSAHGNEFGGLGNEQGQFLGLFDNGLSHFDQSPFKISPRKVVLLAAVIWTGKILPMASEGPSKFTLILREHLPVS